MGYDFYITRKKNLLLDKDGPVITPEEWLSVVHSDPELTLDSPDTEPFFAAWSASGEYPCWIDYDADSGSLFSSSPTDEFFEKMAQIAKVLNGSLQGEAGERYHNDGTLEGTWIIGDDQQWHLA